MSESFSVPFGVRDGEQLVATVVLSHPLKRGSLDRIASQIQRIAAMAEETLPEEETPYNHFWYTADEASAYCLISELE